MLFGSPSPEDQQPPVVALVFGAGINYALVDFREKAIARLLTWSGLLRYLAWHPEGMPASYMPPDEATAAAADAGNPPPPLQLPQDDRLKRRVRLLESMLSDEPDPDRFAAIAHLLRKDMTEQEWKAALDSVMELLCGKQRPHLVWRRVLERAGNLARRGLIKIITTNFDPLLALWCGLNVLAARDPYSAGDQKERVRKQPLDLWTPDPTGRDNSPVAGTDLHKYDLLHWLPSAWESWRAGDGPLKETVCREIASVLHLHGWAGAPGDIVFNTVEYHDTGKKTVARECPNDLMGRLLEEKHATLFLGTKDGILDPHFDQIWRNACSDVPSPEGMGNWWLLSRNRDKTAWEKWETTPLLYRGGLQTVWHEDDGLSGDTVALAIETLFDRLESSFWASPVLTP
jgi:hypothetical protein